MNIGDQNNLNDDIQTVKRRSRSRKPRSKRRNTIAGTDQREIEEAVKGYGVPFSLSAQIFLKFIENSSKHFFFSAACARNYMMEFVFLCGINILLYIYG